MITYEIEFVDIPRRRKFSYTGVTEIKFINMRAHGAVSLIGTDPVTNERYGTRVPAREFSYFTVNKEDNNE